MIFTDGLDRDREGWAFIFALSLSIDSFGQAPPSNNAALTPFPLTSHTLLAIGIKSASAMSAPIR